MSEQKRFFEPPKQGSYFIFGPRGTGKSTLIRNLYPQALVIDLLSEVTFRKYTHNPDLLIEIIRADETIKTIILDEIQKVPALLSVVHKIIEDHKKRSLRFVLTGSSSRKLKVTGVDLLSGRALLYHLHPFMFSELEKKITLPQALTCGLLPLILMSAHPEKTLESYIALYLREEVKQEGLVRNLSDFSRFLEVMSYSHGELLNLSEISREAEIKRTTAIAYFSILKDLLLGSELPCFKKGSRKAVVDHGKFYYFDTGVFRTLRPSGPLDRPEFIEGAALEGLVHQNLSAWISYTSVKHELFFWRTKSQNEVDFVVYGKSVFAAIEVKSAKSLKSKDFSGLLSFREDFPQAKLILLYRGKERILKEGILCMNVEDFLRNLKPNQSFL